MLSSLLWILPRLGSAYSQCHHISHPWHSNCWFDFCWGWPVSLCLHLLWYHVLLCKPQVRFALCSFKAFSWFSSTYLYCFSAVINIFLSTYIHLKKLIYCPLKSICVLLEELSACISKDWWGRTSILLLFGLSITVLFIVACCVQHSVRFVEDIKIESNPDLKVSYSWMRNNIHLYVYAYAVDPWMTWVWAAQVHLYMDFFH